jgi:hypothetical protein
MRADRCLRATLLLGAVLMPGLARADSVSLSWTAPGDDGNAGRAAAYELRYSQSPVAAADTASWWASATSVGTLPAPRTAGTRESFVVAGLAPATTYYFGIRTADEAPNWSGYSNIAVKATSSGTVTLATPANFQADLESGAIQLTWTEVPSGGPELGYHLYRKAAAEPSPTLLASLPVTAVSYGDSTAAAGVTYDFSLRSYDENGESAPATLQIATPSEGAVLAATPDQVHGYPNPARDQVTFRLNVESGATGATKVTVFDLTGHTICLLANQEFTPGSHTISWACVSDAGYKVAPGIYNVIVDGPSGRAVTRVAIVP